MTSAEQPTPPPAGATREWNARVLRLAVPMILSNVSVPLLGAVDTAVMGHLPDPAYIGAVAVGAMIFTFVYWGFGFLRMGTTGFTAQADGAGDGGELAAILWRAGLSALAIAALILVLQVPIALLAIELLNPSPKVGGLARIYFDIRVWGAPATLVTYVLLGWLLGIGNAKAVLFLQLLLNGLNIALNLFFVLGLGMEIEGVALATLISEWTAVCVGLGLALRQLGATTRRPHWPQILHRTRLFALFKVNFDIFIRTLCMELAFAGMTRFSAQQGDLLLAANAILLNLQSVMAYALDGFAHAAEVLAGSAVGARSRARFRSAIKISTIWALGMAIVLTAVYAWLGGPIINLFTNLEQVRETARVYLPWMIVSPFISVWSFQLDGIFIGATRTAAMRNAMIASTASFFIAAVFLLPAWANHGLWLSFVIFMASRAITLGFYLPALDRAVQKPQPAV